MATLKEIRNRIKTINNTQQITRAMKMVAAADLRRVQSSLGTVKDYADRTEQILAEMLGSEAEDPLINPFIKTKEEADTAVYAIIVGNRGLCGVYNVALVQYAKKILDADSRSKRILIAGKWGKDFIVHNGINADREFPDLSENPGSQESCSLAEILKEWYMEPEICEVNLIYQTYVSALKQEPAVRKLFPLEDAVREAFGTDEDVKSGDFQKVEYYYESERAAVLDRLIETFIDNLVLSVLKETKCAEHTARMTAMTNANDNIDKMLEKLQISYNRVRQENITNEISEIVGGAAALK